jgi:CRP/FNR family transcriptional regulator
MNIERLLEKSDFFNGISKRNLNFISAICVPKEAGKRQVLFLEGQEGNYMFLLGEGKVQLYKNSEAGREIVIKIIDPGEIFAEVVIFEEASYPVSAMALRKSRLLLIPKRQIICLLEDESFRLDFIRMLMKKQRYLTERILDLTLHDVEERLNGFLLQQGGESPEYRITMSKRDVASAIGTTPETLSRLILKLRQEGSLEWEQGWIRLSKSFWKTKQ